MVERKRRRTAEGQKRAVQVAKGVKVARGKEEKMRKKPGGSSAGKYKKVPPSDFCGSAGGTSKYSYPVNSLKRAKNALARAHYAPNPEGIRSCVKRKWGKQIKSLSKQMQGKRK